MKSGELFASIVIEFAAFQPVGNPFAAVGDEPVHLGGSFEIATYSRIVWDDNDTCDLCACGVVLTKHRGVPSMLNEEWEALGKPGSLYSFWRRTPMLLQQSLHDSYIPASRLIIRKTNLFIELDEVRSFEEEPGMNVKTEPEQKQKSPRTPRTTPDRTNSHGPLQTLIMEAIKAYHDAGNDAVTPVKLLNFLFNTYTNSAPKNRPIYMGEVIKIIKATCKNECCIWLNGKDEGYSLKYFQDEFYRLKKKITS